jgi:general stress protein 26
MPGTANPQEIMKVKMYTQREYDGGHTRGYMVFNDLERKQTAIFFTEKEAADYCEYRNEMALKFSTDSVEAIRNWRETRNEMELC